MMRKCWKTSRKETSSLSKGMPIHDLMSMRAMYPRRRRTKSPCFSVILPAGIPCRVCFSQRTFVTLLSLGKVPNFQHVGRALLANAVVAQNFLGRGQGLFAIEDQLVGE